MKSFGFLSFGHHNRSFPPGRALKEGLELAIAAESFGVNGAYFRVHHFSPQYSAPIPLLSAIAARTSTIEIGTGVIDMRYENPLYLAEELAALNHLADGRLAIGISRGSPEQVYKGWEAFGYHSSEPKAQDLAREKFLTFLSAARGEPQAVAAPSDQQYPRIYAPGKPLSITPDVGNLSSLIWWGAGSQASAIQSARDGVNLMSSTLVFDSRTTTLSEAQYQHIMAYKEAWTEAGWSREPRVSVTRTIIPIVNERDRRDFGTPGSGSSERHSMLDGQQAILGQRLIDTPENILKTLLADRAVCAADTLMLAIPNLAGLDANIRLLNNFAIHIAPELVKNHGL
ncbi:LLM class flavin-dependent oxidoreductase [Corynebacterium sp. ES2775-CONJ]|uniref:LLM class flavin-dependent oxidoreductase n=1 Tax=Corynebacterium sp. ES2775-CONJ TaxID=2974029 RepID=UPI00216A589A|nr:LLM class flavin-dependent oxidoreductase [Corynebacterium sp. ES2775-CONJ]MCS4490185.1 LLM class flavin-dependent oxidoreductase [Corynebacterium sp. ES2775-CONJ]